MSDSIQDSPDRYDRDLADQGTPAEGQGFATRAVHGGMWPSLHRTRPTVTPIYATSTFVGDDTEVLDTVLGSTAPGYVYGRYDNPTISALETAVSGLEGAAATVAFASGMAALHAALLLCELEPGSVVLAGSDLYGASHTLLATLLGGFDVQTRFVDMADLEAVEREVAVEPRPRVLLFEAFSNPLIKVADVAGVCAAAHSAGALTVIDSTFTPPPLLQPLKLGADIVVHSATKYYSGHGDVTGGLVCIGDSSREASLRQIRKLAGSILGPFEAFLIARGVKTLELRVTRQCRNAAVLTPWLVGHPVVSAVNYPGLASHPQYALASSMLQGSHPGAMLSFEIRNADREQVFRFFDALHLIIPVTTLGDVYTQVSYPMISSHRDWSPAQLRRGGITPGLVRLSLGIEDINDIMADLSQALHKSVPQHQSVAVRG